MSREGGFVIVDFIKENVVRIVGQHCNVEFPAARLLYGVGAIFFNGLEKLSDLVRGDVEIDRVDVEGASLRRRIGPGSQ